MPDTRTNAGRAGAGVKVGGAPEGFDARLLAREVERHGAPVLHVARDAGRMEAMRSALGFLAPELPVVTFPAWECLPFDRVSPNADVSAARMAVLAALAGGMPGPFALLTTLNATTQRVPPRDVLRSSSFTAEVGRRVDERALRDFLARMGFTQAPTVVEPGDYAIRGGIIDVYPPGDAGPVRMDLFGDVLDEARRFDPDTQRTTEKLARVDLAPVSEVILDEPAIARFRQNYRVHFGAAGGDDPLYESVSNGRKHAGVEHWLGFFHERLETLFDYLPEATVMLDHQLTPTRLARWDLIVDSYQSRHRAQEGSKGALRYNPAPPELLYLDDGAWEAALAPHRTLALSPLPQAPGPGVIDAGGRDRPRLRP